MKKAKSKIRRTKIRVETDNQVANKSTNTENRVLYRNLGGTHRMKEYVPGKRKMKTKIIKPNKTFWAYPSQISDSFSDKIVSVHGLPKAPETEPIPPTYDVRSRPGAKGWFDVVDGSEKVMNETAMRQSEAFALMDALQGKKSENMETT